MDAAKTAGAIFSPDRKFRFVLWRAWDLSKSTVVFIGLNPSIADDTKNDPTMTRLCNFANKWGFGGLQMLNLYALVATNPKELIKHGSPDGPNNDRYIYDLCRSHTLTVVCWGANKMAAGRAEVLVPKLRNWCNQLKCFGRTKGSKRFPNGAPKHPLFLRADTQLQNF